MITILHGDNTTVSRQALYDILQQSSAIEKLTIDGKSLSKADLIQYLEPQSLFAQSKVVVVERLIRSLRPGKKRDEIIQYLCDAPFDTDVILWEDKAVGRSLIKLKRHNHVTVHEYKLPVKIFALVDGLGTRSAQALIELFRDVLSSSPVEIVFSMVIRQSRLLLALKLQADIPETTRLAPWQKGKLQKQADLFTKSQLRRMHQMLMLIDYQTKTGRSFTNLTKRLEQFMLDISLYDKV